MLLRPGVSAETRAVADVAAALAELELGRVAAARRRIERAKAESLANGLRAETAQLQLGLAVVLLHAEEPDAALCELTSASALADEPAVMAEIASQRVLILMRLGHYDEALSESDHALAAVPSNRGARPLVPALVEPVGWCTPTSGNTTWRRRS